MALAKIKRKLARRNKIRSSIRKKISGTPERPRLSIFRSNNEIYAQIIDDVNGHTLTSASSLNDLKNDKSTRIDQSKQVGQIIAKKAIEAGITNIVFDRGGYLYHGRVKALAEGAREGGLKF